MDESRENHPCKLCAGEEEEEEEGWEGGGERKTVEKGEEMPVFDVEVAMNIYRLHNQLRGLGNDGWSKEKIVSKLFNFMKNDLPGLLGKSFTENYTIVKLLGGGGNGYCLECRDIKDEEKVIKVIPITTRNKAAIDVFQKEIVMMDKIQKKPKKRYGRPDRLFLNLEHFFCNEDGSILFLQMPKLGDGRDLKKEFDQREKNGTFTLAFFKRVVYLVTKILLILQTSGVPILHLDLKPSNIIYYPGEDDNSFELQIIDYALAMTLGDHTLKEIRKMQQWNRGKWIGSKAYTVGELNRDCPDLEKEDLLKLDIGSFGRMLLFMIHPDELEAATKGEEVADSVEIAVEKARMPATLELTEPAKNFINSCLEKDPKKRAGINDLKDHEFLKDFVRISNPYASDETEEPARSNPLFRSPTLSAVLEFQREHNTADNCFLNGNLQCSLVSQEEFEPATEVRYYLEKQGKAVLCYIQGKNKESRRACTEIIKWCVETIRTLHESKDEENIKLHTEVVKLYVQTLSLMMANIQKGKYFSSQADSANQKTSCINQLIQLIRLNKMKHGIEPELIKAELFYCIFKAIEYDLPDKKEWKELKELTELTEEDLKEKKCCEEEEEEFNSLASKRKTVSDNLKKCLGDLKVVLTKLQQLEDCAQDDSVKHEIKRKYHVVETRIVSLRVILARTPAELLECCKCYEKIAEFRSSGEERKNKRHCSQALKNCGKGFVKYFELLRKESGTKKEKELVEAKEKAIMYLEKAVELQKQFKGPEQKEYLEEIEEKLRKAQGLQVPSTVNTASTCSVDSTNRERANKKIKRG